MTEVTNRAHINGLVHHSNVDLDYCDLFEIYLTNIYMACSRVSRGVLIRGTANQYCDERPLDCVDCLVYLWRE